tara:strand:+ start:1559 stop:1891 length:333 start_codon:yes stop_codon:yes gene_type:complete
MLNEEYKYVTNSLQPKNRYHDDYRNANWVDWSTKGLKVTRLRIATDQFATWWDISYCHGTYNGEKVVIDLPFDRLPKKNFKKYIINWAIKEKVYAKGLGILDDCNISKLW